MVKLEMNYPNWLTKEVKLCIVETLVNLGSVTPQISTEDEEVLEFFVKAEDETKFRIFLNLLSINDCGGAYTKNLTDLFGIE